MRDSSTATALLRPAQATDPVIVLNGSVQSQEQPAPLMKFGVVAVFFSSILTDPSLPPRIRALSLWLKEPIRRLAIHDRTIYSNRRHPVLLLLREIARCGFSSAMEEDDIERVHFSRITDLVGAALGDSDEHPPLFSMCWNAPNTYIDLHRTLARLVRRQVAQDSGSQSGDSIPDDAVDRVAGKLGTDHCVEARIAHFVIETWQRVMIQVQYTHGVDSIEWPEARQTLDDLVWCACDHRDERSRQRQATLRPALKLRLTASLASGRAAGENANPVLADILDALDSRRLR